MIKARILRLILTLVIGVVASAGVNDLSANDSYDSIIKYRKQVMIANAAHITAIFSVINGETHFTKHLAAHATSISQSARFMLETYPPGSDVGRTDAKPAIWIEWDKFVAAAKSLEQTANELASVSDSGDMKVMRQRAEAVGKSCGGCHNSFRKKR